MSNWDHLWSEKKEERLFLSQGHWLIIKQVLLRFAILHGKGKAVDVAELRRSSVAGPTLLMGRTVAWSIKSAKALIGP